MFGTILKTYFCGTFYPKITQPRWLKNPPFIFAGRRSSKSFTFPHQNAMHQYIANLSVLTNATGRPYLIKTH
jgi:hypothetical protein